MIIRRYQAVNLSRADKNIYYTSENEIKITHYTLYRAVSPKNKR